MVGIGAARCHIWVVVGLFLVVLFGAGMSNSIAGLHAL